MGFSFFIGAFLRRKNRTCQAAQYCVLQDLSSFISTVFPSFHFLITQPIFLHNGKIDMHVIYLRLSG